MGAQPCLHGASVPLRALPLVIRSLCSPLRPSQILLIQHMFQCSRAALAGPSLRPVPCLKAVWNYRNLGQKMGRDSSLTFAHEGSLSPGEGGRQQWPFHLCVY